MSVWKTKLEDKHRAAKLVAHAGIESGANKRAVNLLPVPGEHDNHDIFTSSDIRYKSLLLSMEAKQSNACLRIFSEREKSRSAILIYRGRVMGCMHGEKQTGQHLFGEQAYRKAIDDLARPDNLVDTYLLSQELVLAAGALFHGHQIKVAGANGTQQFINAAVVLQNSNFPGCIVVNSNFSHTVCLVYMFFGKIIGVYSFKHGWVEPSYESAIHYAEFTHGCRISATALAARNTREAEALTFSLSGLDAEAITVPLPTLHNCDPALWSSKLSRPTPQNVRSASIFVGNKR